MLGRAYQLFIESKLGDHTSNFRLYYNILEQVLFIYQCYRTTVRVWEIQQNTLILYKVGYELQLAPITNSADREYTSRFGKLLRDEWIMTSYKPRFSLSDQGQSLFRKLHIAYVETVQPMRASKIPNNCYMTWLMCYSKDINYNILSCLNINIMFCFGKYLQRGLHCFCYWFRLQPEGEELGGGMRSR